MVGLGEPVALRMVLMALRRVSMRRALVACWRVVAER